MIRDRILECSFLIPIYRDVNLSDGDVHANVVWKWLDGELFQSFGGRTIAPGLYEGFYRDPNTREQISDESRKYIVAIPQADIDELRDLLADACIVFEQKCIYLSIAGEVEFVSNPLS